MHRYSPLALGVLAVTLTLTAAPAEAASLTRQPYLQRVGPDTATVAFRLSASCEASVRYGPGGGTGQEARSQASGRVHAVALARLQPGTEYTYVVEACGTRTSPRRFRTAPVPGTRRVHFAALGDMGTGGTAQRDVSKAMHGRRPELFITLGDNAYASGTEQEFQSNFFEPMEELLSEVPLFATLGNHEYVTNEGQPYLDNLYLPTSPSGGERYYSFDWGHVHFVALDSNCAIGLASPERCTLEAQRRWLEEDLAASKASWKVVFFHHPPWSSGEHGSQLKMRREFTPLFEQYGVDLVLTGHDHNYERSHAMKGEAVANSGARGIPYLVVGSGGARLRDFETSKPSWSALRNNRDYGYLDVEVEEGRLSARLLTPSGAVVDSLTLTKQLPPAAQPEPAPAPEATPAPDVETAPVPQPVPEATPAPGPAPAPPVVTPAPPPPPSVEEPDEGEESLGGLEPGAGCSTGAGATLLPLGALLLAGALRRRRR
jgi:uncharacterized protein (TIGR03382 family)